VVWRTTRKEMCDVSEIIQILRSTNVNQCKGQYYDDGKYCATGAAMHEKYGWYGKREVCIPNRELMSMSIFHGGIWNTILDLNDRDAKSFSEIADALEKMYLADRI
jgi:hypothetical protein